MTPASRLIFGHDEKVAAWVAGLIPHVSRGFGECRAIGVASDDGRRIIAGVVYHDYQPEHRTVQISMAARSALWARPNNIYALLSVPFEQYRVFKVWVAIPHDNQRAIRFCAGIGMKGEATLRHHFGRKRHAVIYSMTWDEYVARWRQKEAA
jgi:RimJ/RimL family protein N-acetyltransferase